MLPDHRKCKQVLVNGNLHIPDHKPPLERILRVTTRPEITKTVVIDGKVIFAGYVLVCVEYVACVPGNEQPVHFASFKVPLADFIEHPCVHASMTAQLGSIVEFQEFEVQDQRAISKLVVVKVCILELTEKKHAHHPCPPENMCYAGDPLPCTPCGPETRPGGCHPDAPPPDHHPYEWRPQPQWRKPPEHCCKPPHWHPATAHSSTCVKTPQQKDQYCPSCGKPLT